MNNFEFGKNSVKFKSQGVMLAGDLYLPDNFDSSKKYPTLVFAGPFNQVKEQMGAIYGPKIAKKGYIFLAFDHMGYGESEGKPRNSENPYVKMENIRNSISYIRTLPFVDREQLYGLGACAGGGYMPTVAVSDKRIKAVVTVSGLLNKTKRFLGKLSPEQMKAAFTFANEARQKEYETGEVEYFDGMGFDNVDPDNLPEARLMREGYDYYMTERAGVPNFSALTPKTLMEIPPLTNATALAPYLHTPYLGIYGEFSMEDNGPQTIAFYEACTEPKELYEVKGGSHVSLYDNEEQVNEIVDRMDEFFKKY